MNKNNALAVEGGAKDGFHLPSTSEICLPSSSGAPFPLAGQRGERTWLTPDEVEERLVEAWRLWRRSPGGGHWPFASDGPWHLMSRETRAGDWDARGVDGVDGGEAAAPREGTLSIAEVAERDRVSGWLAFAGERDGPLVSAVVEQLGRGAKRPDFMVLRSRFLAKGRTLGADGLRKRYGRALSAIAQKVGRVGASLKY